MAGHKARILDREDFIDYWVEYIQTHTDKEWSRQQNVLINSALRAIKKLP